MRNNANIKELPPQPDKMLYALRKIGYGLEQSLSDIIDNSITANAKNIIIRFMFDEQHITGVAIIDDGDGMDDKVIDEAMRFGSEMDRAVGSLGKFGMGMKLASLGHANDLIVLSKNNSTLTGREWTVESISEGWFCRELPENEIKNHLLSVNSNLANKKVDSGTVVYWKKVESIKTKKSGVEDTLKGVVRKLKVHLGLHFHRFLEEEDGLSIHITALDTISKIELLDFQVFPLNPFPPKEISPLPDFPLNFNVDIPNIGELVMKAYIWPPNSDQAQYKLGGKAASMQGFYFYRNKRLLQAGGWNGLVNSDAEPHGSLARVAINLPVKFDNHFGVNVQKDKVNVPENFLSALNLAESDGGRGFFSDYRRMAQKVYRKKSDKAKLERVIVPAKGIPKPVIYKINKQAADVYEREGKPRPDYRGINFEWVDFQEEKIFTIDRDTDTILLNQAFRSELLLGEKGSPTDLPLIKILIMFLVQEDFGKTKTSTPRQKELDYINRVMISTLKFRR